MRPAYRDKSTKPDTGVTISKAQTILTSFVDVTQVLVTEVLCTKSCLHYLSVIHSHLLLVCSSLSLPTVENLAQVTLLRFMQQPTVEDALSVLKCAI